MSALMRLRVPLGWAVLDNKFYDVSPIPATDSESFIDNWDEGFIEEDVKLRYDLYKAMPACIRF